MMTSSSECIVLVTGGSGFLGQHLIGLLQTHAPHVTEIRVLDMTPYHNKLDYKGCKPVIQFTGSIEDKGLLYQACGGVACVMHVAGVVDVSMFPNNERMTRINVHGTSTLLDVCREAGVQRFIYCSSVSVAVGYSGVENGTESGAQPPELFLFNGYASSKLQAERIVLKSNSDTFKTVAIRPVPMYGEEDPQYVTQPLKVARKTGFWTIINCDDAIHQSAYVGNVAWSFICADKALIEENGDFPPEIDLTDDHVICGDSVDPLEVGGNAFNIADDTPLGNMFEMKNPIAVACNHSVNVCKIPLCLIIVSCYIIYFFLLLLSPIVKLNFPYSINSFRQLQISYTFNCDKAKTVIQYTPFYDYEESLERSIRFYKQFAR